ncbi:hypothetical protein T484DRAFT_1894991 [Baffinella frigidus]|nr:hypothetical protein T484DRAFT_1894991 [Cryptophyta sp. CCMP2293]
MKTAWTAARDDPSSNLFIAHLSEEARENKSIYATGVGIAKQEALALERALWRASSDGLAAIEGWKRGVEANAKAKQELQERRIAAVAEERERVVEQRRIAREARDTAWQAGAGERARDAREGDERALAWQAGAGERARESDERALEWEAGAGERAREVEQGRIAREAREAKAKEQKLSKKRKAKVR